MNKQLILALRGARKSVSVLSGKKATLQATNRAGKEVANQWITSALLDDAPLMVARLGAVELSCVANYKSISAGARNIFDYITFKSEAFWWDSNTMFQMSNNAGFFPATPAMLEQFSLMMIEDMKLTDILGSWLWQEKLFQSELEAAKKINLLDLEPYYHQNPWSMALQGKKVLIVHPFTESIMAQYKKKDLLFAGKQILPDFELTTIKAVQSIANNKTGFKDWFAALQFMKDQITATNFDIAIIGCGAYGFPLAAHVKRLGKKAVHLGGATQTLFGITGKRWEEKKEHMHVAQMINEHWTRPTAKETPEGTHNIEGACYW